MDFFTHMLEEEIPIPSCSATIEETGVSAPEPEPEPEPKVRIYWWLLKRGDVDNITIDKEF